MKMSDSWNVIQGDEQCRDGHYRAKQDVRTRTVTSQGGKPAPELDPNNSTSVQAQNPTDIGKLRSMASVRWVRFARPKHS
jgi:hypothetical protein